MPVSLECAEYVVSRKPRVRRCAVNLPGCGWFILGTIAALAQESPLVIPRRAEPPNLED